ncbi:hypothetical protein HPB49_023501 [Dermacentor silvarum]|uniref:Uncharacterized protein n=1 Tax=Dermacentor silvarum TaxID=543639 RepID=A0ACB8D8L9_DERSI|nr:hypothetical protein HPB49_023501 [Dermacentor silvarum]
MMGTRETLSCLTITSSSTRLMVLLKLCRTCLSTGCTVKLQRSGTRIIAKVECPDMHTYTWSSQPLVGDKPKGNIHLATALLFSGSSVASSLRMMCLMGVKVISEQCFFNYQKAYLLPAVNMVPSRTSSPYLMAQCRTLIAALHFIENSEREQSHTAHGESQWHTKTSLAKPGISAYELKTAATFSKGSDGDNSGEDSAKVSACKSTTHDHKVGEEDDATGNALGILPSLAATRPFHLPDTKDGTFYKAPVCTGMP